MPKFSIKMPQRWKGIISHYADFLPVSNLTPMISLCEGNTPLVCADRFTKLIGGNFDLFLKLEGANPTASFKDRGMTMAISKACEKGSAIVACASTGNTSASAAAYSARSGLKCVVILPHGNIARGKLSQALIYGAETIAIRGNFDEALQIVRKLGEKGEVEIVNSINPVRIEGQKTAAFEICDQLGRAPDFHFLPVGNAGNIAAYWKGFVEFFNLGRINFRPKMCGFQASGAAPIVEGNPISNPQTLATAIRIGNPAGWIGATKAIKESGGLIDKVSDEEILNAYQMLAESEGIFAEPASVAPLAGLINLVKKNMIPSKSLITATLTGHGLKDPERAEETAGKEPLIVDPDVESVSKLIGI